MGLNDTPSGERVHIGFFGKRNAGKSSIVNAVTGQDLAVVSDVKGTTTDPVYKSMELLPLGPVMIIDTPGSDDVGTLGELRIRKTRQVLNKTDIAVLVVDASEGFTDADAELMELIRTKEIPFLIVYNKADLLPSVPHDPENGLYVSARNNFRINELKERIAALKPDGEKTHLIADRIKPGEIAILVIPIDKAAPKGRLILPQQQTIRDILDAGAGCIVIKENALKGTLKAIGIKPAMVITDSQVFERVALDTPESIPLTSFSILLARQKGYLEEAVRGVAALPRLSEGDPILIAEGCTHHRQCNDIGTVKIPGWLKQYTGKNFEIHTCSGTEFPEDLSPYSLIIHCGGCMLNEREVRYRAKCAADQGVPITNYGILIAQIHGILKRSLSVFPELADELK